MRREPVGWGLRVAGALVLLACALVACGGPAPSGPAPEPAVEPTATSPQPEAAPAVRPTATPAAPAERIALVGPDDHIYAVDPDGSNLVRVSPATPRSAGDAAPLRRVHNWPTWSPDGRRLAFTRLTVDNDGNAVAGEVLVGAVGASASARVFATDAGGPIYLAWSPDGGRLAMLVQEGEALRLLVGDGDRRTDRTVATGSPLYFAWSPDSSRLLVHTGGDGRRGEATLGLVEPAADEPSVRSLGPTPNGFRSPAWLGDGLRGVWSAAGANGAADGIVAGSPDEAASGTVLGPAGSAPAFVVSPSGDEVAFGEAMGRGRPLYRGISLQRPGEPVRRLVTEPVAAFFWSPDGRRLAYAGVNGDGDSLAWFVIDRTGGDPKLVHDLRPNRSVSQFLLYFDQYAQSMSIWSPDGSRLLVTTLEQGDAGRRTSVVYSVPVDGGDPRRLGEGKLAVWSPPVR